VLQALVGSMLDKCIQWMIEIALKNSKTHEPTGPGVEAIPEGCVLISNATSERTGCCASTDDPMDTT
jgi:hypothetical protein